MSRTLRQKPGRDGNEKETEAQVLSWERIGVQWVMGVRGEYSQGLQLCPGPRVRLLREENKTVWSFRAESRGVI